MSNAIIQKYLEDKSAVEAQRPAYKEQGKRLPAVPSPKIKLTNAMIDRLSPTGFEYYLRDSEVTGLRLCVHDTGTKTFEVAKKVAGRSTVMKVAEYQKGVGVAATRKQAIQIVADADKGITVAENKENIRQEKAVEAGEQTTFKQAADFFLSAKGQIADSTRSNYERYRDNQLASFHKKRMTDITEDGCRKLHQKLTKDRGPAPANDGLKFFNQVWRANTRRLGLGVSPAIIFSKNDADAAAWNVVEPRINHVAPDDLKLFFDTLDSMAGKYPGDGELARDYMQFLVFTGLRRREATGITADDIDYRNNIIYIGKNKSKRTGYNIPLTPEVRKILDRRPTRPFDFDEPDKMFAWITKQTLGKTTTATKEGRVDGIVVSSHDMRRTFTTCADDVELGVSDGMIKALLNHSIAGDVTDSSYKQTLKDPKQRYKAAVKIQDFILQKAGRTPGNVVAMKAVSNA